LLTIGRGRCREEKASADTNVIARIRLRVG